jgi:hypothetical protein
MALTESHLMRKDRVALIFLSLTGRLTLEAGRILVEAMGLYILTILDFPQQGVT